jgi:uncharacterized surface protein with fasciclin (FAS1) repeats
MKKLLTTFGLLFTIATAIFAQTPPNAFSYSAVARDANSNPIATTTIGIQISLRQGSPLGTVVYQENHFVNTDQFGLFNLTVGGGSVQSGNISTIDWAAANYYLQVGMDANGGINFLNMGTTQLLSVPYALYAKSAGSVSGGTGITITSVSTAGDTLYLSNGQTFVTGGSGGGTNGTLASVTTANATNVLDVSATLGGNVTASGGELVLARGVCVSNTVNPTVDDVVIADGSGIGAFTPGVSGLQAGSTYHVRAYATNSAGTAYGNNVNFTTQAQDIITSLGCDFANNSGTLTAGAPASGVSSTVFYTGGNGGTYNGQTVNSTGLTGLTATLSAGNFASGSGSLTYTITGTPSAAGTANFSLNIGGQNCTLSRTVNSPVGSISSYIQGNANFSDLLQALTRPDLSTNFVNILSGAGPFTFFAPTNYAFQILFAELGVSTINDIPAAALESILAYHIVNGTLLAASLTEGQIITTLQGGTITVQLSGGATLLDGAGRVVPIIAVDISATNGVIHIIDKVLIPY